ncbi:MAG: UvrD-helicase domain-containing protein, partial [Desulfatiglandales bacterium]
MGHSPNPEQQEAIEAPSALHLLIQAGPGTGKTFTLVMRILYLLENGEDPSQMLCLTFTRRAKTELENRLKRYTESLPEIRTFHSLALSVLRESAGLLGLSPDFTLVDPQDAQRLRERSKIEGHEGLLTYSKLTENSPHPKELMDKAIIS